jgi:hypothetical protein
MEGFKFCRKTDVLLIKCLTLLYYKKIVGFTYSIIFPYPYGILDILSGQIDLLKQRNS